MNGLNSLLNQIQARLKSILARGVISTVNDDNGRQFCDVSVLSGEVKRQVERIQHWGFSSVPPKGSGAILGFIGADRNRPVILGDDNVGSRPKGLSEGDNIIYDAHGNSVHLKDGVIVINAAAQLQINAPQGVSVDTPLFEVTGEIKDLSSSGGATMSAMRSVFNGHTHKENDVQGQTNTPTQQMGGSA